MNLVHEIRRACERSGVSTTRFGRMAAGDPRLFGDLRKGREPRPVTVARIRSTLQTLEATHG